MRVKKMAVLALCSALLLSTGVQVSAKDYYQKSYGSPKNGFGPKTAAYEKTGVIEYLELAEKDVGEIKAKSVTAVKDFNLDGKKEKFELCIKPTNDATKAIIKINGKTVATKNTSAIQWGVTSYKLGTKTIVVLYWGGLDSSTSIVAYEWKDNKLKKFSEYDYGMEICYGVMKDQKSKKQVFFIQHNEQLSNHYGEKWPKNVLKKYKKYAKKKTTSVTRIVYERYQCKGNKLEKGQTDNYYYVSDVYN
ncbi:MAG TPA: hypothetical protein DEO89_00115 [Lachnospiraceae bacterium]|nr:hypothetical protein [Lachnospiraceae bacterium]